MTRLPRSIDELAGLRAARWVRESTAGQADNFGPDSQRRMQDEAIERWALIDSGIGWEVAHSGKTIGATSQWSEMLAAAGVAYDVLVVGYVSRFARDLRTAVNARHELHAAGAVLLFADDRILTSDEDAWEHWAREAVEAEAYSRRLGKRIREGYAAKGRRWTEQAGRAAFGFTRETEKPHRLTVDQTRISLVQRAYELAAAGVTDRAISLQLTLPLFTVRGILTSPLYCGRLRTGERAHWQPLVDVDLWERAQAVRARRATNTGRPAARRRPYALPMLRCAACHRRLSGDTGYYRHRDACPVFLAARPKGVARGKAYRREWYEAAVGALLRTVSLRADTITRVVAEIVEPASVPNHLALARVSRGRDQAARRYLRDRDSRALEATMARLDVDEHSARNVHPAEGIPAARAVSWLASLAAAWMELRDDDGPERTMLARSLFVALEATGFRELGVRLTPDAIAHGFADVLPSSFVIPAATLWKESGREVSARHFPAAGIRIRILDRRVARPLRALRTA